MGQARTAKRLTALAVKGIKLPGVYADGDGLVLSSSLQQLSPTALPAQTLFEYDPAGRATKVRSRMGRRCVLMVTILLGDLQRIR